MTNDEKVKLQNAMSVIRSPIGWVHSLEELWDDDDDDDGVNEAINADMANGEQAILELFELVT